MLAQVPLATGAASAAGAALDRVGAAVGGLMLQDNLKCAGSAWRSSQLNQPNLA